MQITLRLFEVLFLNKKYVRIISRLVLVTIFLSHVSIVKANSVQSFNVNGFIESTYLVEFLQGSDLTKVVSNYSQGGYEDAGGQWVSFRPWYKRRYGWTDARMTLVTQLSERLGVIWGASTGEWGEKYHIEPSIKIGFVYQVALENKQSFLSIRASTIFRGHLHEKPCTADYGEIGGVQKVNCRLAASTLSPADTLRYLDNRPPSNKLAFMLIYQKKI